MIIMKIFGGLGNQMFQYAMGRSVAHMKNVKLKLDLSWFGKDETTTKRICCLDKFNIIKDVASDNEVYNYLKWRKKLGRDLYQMFIPFRCKKYIKMNEFSAFDGQYLEVGDNVYLEGYWTDERFFADITQIIRKEFTLKDELSPINKEMASAITKSVESVSIHIRRGDYIKDELTNKLFNICDNRYYLRAIEEIKKRLDKPQVFIFSDDIEWVKNNMNTGCETYYVSKYGEGFPHEEIILMSMCSHNIIANSTFSWWGAWLNPNPDKIVIAPERWYNLDSYDGGDCVPSGWFKIPTF